MIHWEAEQLWREANVAVDSLRVRIDEEFVVVEAMAFFRIVGPFYSVAVALIGLNVWEVAVPNVVGDFGQANLRFFACFVE